MTYFNNLILKENHVEYVGFTPAYILESEANRAADALNGRVIYLLRDAFDVTCEKVENFEKGMLEIDDIQVNIDCEMNKRKYSPFHSMLQRIMRKENEVCGMCIVIDYEITMKENISKNYLKLKDYDLYDRIYGKEFNAQMYINFYTLFSDFLCRWTSDDMNA